MEKKSMICIVCPLGCKMQAVKSDAGVEVEGHQCARGKEYAHEEMTNPTRMVTSTVKIRGAALPRLPVKTAAPIPKKLILPCIKELESVELEGPVRMGDTIVSDLLGTGVNIVATRSMGR